jgi:hypothetical protein
MTLEVDIAPRFDYSRRPHGLHLTDSGAIFKSDDFSMTLHVVREADDARLADVRTHWPGGPAGPSSAREGSPRMRFR